jgi:hypothetical protein
MDERELITVAANYGVSAEELVEVEYTKRQTFGTRLQAHVEQGLPAQLLVGDFTHWVAVIACREERFIIVDPLDKDCVFSIWNQHHLFRQAWNDTGNDPDTPSQFCALLFRRADGQPPRWTPTLEWLCLCQRGADDTASSMAGDLREMVHRCGTTQDQVDLPLGEFIRQHEKVITRAITHWGEGYGDVTKRELAAFLRDYAIIADAAGVRVAASCDRVALVAQLTALLSAYWWGGAF